MTASIGCGAANMSARVALAEAALEEDRWNIAYWGVVELLWRKLGDPRAEWLSGQPGLLGTFDTAWDEELAAADALLARLHAENVECAGHSVRDGSQTRWNLFDRLEPELAPLRARLEAQVRRYIAGLPPERRDPSLAPSPRCADADHRQLVGAPYRRRPSCQPFPSQGAGQLGFLPARSRGRCGQARRLARSRRAAGRFPDGRSSRSPRSSRSRGGWRCSPATYCTARGGSLPASG